MLVANLHVYLGILQMIVSGVRMLVASGQVLVECGSVFVGFGLLLVVSESMSVSSGWMLSADSADYAEGEILTKRRQAAALQIVRPSGRVLHNPSPSGRGEGVRA